MRWVREAVVLKARGKHTPHADYAFVHPVCVLIPADALVLPMFPAFIAWAKRNVGDCAVNSSLVCTVVLDIPASIMCAYSLVVCMSGRGTVPTQCQSTPTPLRETHTP